MALTSTSLLSASLITILDLGLGAGGAAAVKLGEDAGEGLVALLSDWATEVLGNDASEWWTEVVDAPLADAVTPAVTFMLRLLPDVTQLLYEWC